MKGTYELVEQPKGRKALKTKQVFKLKKDVKKLLKYKTCLVLKSKVLGLMKNFCLL